MRYVSKLILFTFYGLNLNAHKYIFLKHIKQ